MAFHHRHGVIRTSISKFASQTICGRSGWWIAHIHHCTTTPRCKPPQLQGIIFNQLVMRSFKQMPILGFWHRLGKINAWCKFVGENWDRSICEVKKLLPYALICDVSYMCRPWMLAPLKRHNDILLRDEYHWNFVLSSIRMCIKRVFGMLKGRWRIFLKMIDMHLINVPKLVNMCFVLHNIYIIFSDSFWKTKWMQEVTDEVHKGLPVGRFLGAST
jgi:hypothetical protein